MTILAMDSKILNERIRAVCDEGEQYKVPALATTGKVIPYIGWFWRTVDFDGRPITLGWCSTSKSMEYVGFMENNKWDYAQWQVSGEARDRLKQLLEEAVTEPSVSKFQMVYDYMQTLKPGWVS